MFRLGTWTITRPSGFKFTLSIEVDEDKLSDYIVYSMGFGAKIQELEQTGATGKGQRCKGGVKFTVKPLDNPS